MFDHRKRLMNCHEEKTSEILSKISAENNSHVYPKVRIADVLEISSSGLTDDEYSYALKAHFDFVVVDQDQKALFAVEFDGPHHETDRTTIANDAKKNSVCSKLGLPLLRITADFLRLKIRRFTILSWLVEVWFLEQAFNQAQEAGDIPSDEPFLHFAILSDSIQDMQEGKITCPYDLSLPSRVLITKAQRKGLCKDSVPSIHITEGLDQFHATGVALIRVNDSSVIIGQAHCHLFQFGSIGPIDLCKDLVTIDVAEKLKGYFQGRVQSHTLQQALQRVKRLEEAAEKSGKPVWHSGAVWEKQCSFEQAGRATPASRRPALPLTPTVRPGTCTCVSSGPPAPSRPLSGWPGVASPSPHFPFCRPSCYSDGGRSARAFPLHTYLAPRPPS